MKRLSLFFLFICSFQLMYGPVSALELSQDPQLVRYLVRVNKNSGQFILQLCDQVTHTCSGPVLHLNDQMIEQVHAELANLSLADLRKMSPEKAQTLQMPSYLGLKGAAIGAALALVTTRVYTRAAVRNALFEGPSLGYLVSPAGVWVANHSFPNGSLNAALALGWVTHVASYTAVGYGVGRYRNY